MFSIKKYSLQTPIKSLFLVKPLNISFCSIKQFSTSSVQMREKDSAFVSENFLLASFIFKKFISLVMKDGKKFKSEKIFKKILVGISLKGYSPSSVLVLAINNVKPVVDVRTVRRRGKNFRVPFPLKNSRQLTKSIQTLLRVSKNKIFFEKYLIEELITSSKGRSRSIKATLRLHKFAFQNRSFSNYRWF